MNHRINPDIDIVADLLKAVLEVRPEDGFCQSLLQQYRDRGGLSKKQMEGLLGKASKFTNAAPGKLATLEAIILKKHSNYKSEPAAIEVVEEKDETSEPLINSILQKYPGHKRVLFFKMKIEKKDLLNQTEKDELNKFTKLLLK
jgi:hypothetical protein